MGDVEAALMASTTTIMRGAAAPGTATADWKAITVEQFAGFIQVLHRPAASLMCACPPRRK